MEDKIFDLIEEALAKAGFKILDGDHNCVIVRDPKNDKDYEIKVEDIAG